MFSITVIIVIITAIVSFTAFTNEKITNDLIFYPPAVSKQGQWYRFITCGLIHADFMHLLFNMVALYSFGNFVEGAFGTVFGEAGKWIYLLLYLSALVASLMPTYNKNKNNYHYRSLGASGAVGAVMFAGLLLVPTLPIGFIFLPGIDIPGFIFAPLYLLISTYFDKRGVGNVNHSAHIWGAIYGLAFTVVAGYAGGYHILGGFVRGVQGYFAGRG